MEPGPKSLRRKKIIVIVGPTASGKSELAVHLAKRFNGEIISADSRQVYRGLDRGTGKVPGRWQKKAGGERFIYKSIPHYCIDTVSPKKQFSVTEFTRDAKNAIEKIRMRGKIPIIAGGAGFWIDAIVYNLNLPEVRPNMKLRKILAQKSAEKLFHFLKKIDSKRASKIDPRNPRRLIRAIEIAYAIGKSPKIKKRAAYDTLWIGIKTLPDILKLKIKKRLATRLREGMIEEAVLLRKKGLSWKRFYALGLEYRFLADYLQKKMGREELSERLFCAIWHYAKRQMTWFKKNKEIRWVESKKKAYFLTKEFLNLQKSSA